MLSQSKFSQGKSHGPSRAAVRAYLGAKAATKIQKFYRSRAKGREKRVVGGVKRGSRGNSKPVKLYNTINSNVVFPDRLEVNLTTTMCGYIPASLSTAAAGNYMSIMLNSIVGPFNTPTFPMTLGTTTYSYGFHASLVQGYLITANPLGFTPLQSLYTNYRVIAYRLEVTVSPANSSDTCRLVVLPLGAEEIPSTSAANVDLRVIEEQPYALSCTCATNVASGPGFNNTLVLSGAPYKDLGLTREQYLSAGYQTSLGSLPAANITDYAGIFLQQLNGTNNASPLVITCRLTQIVILEDAIQQVN